MPSRRECLLSLAGSVASLWGQGVASRGVKPMLRGKPSGLPFHAQFTDIAAAAGLHAPVLYGGVDRKHRLTVGSLCHQGDVSGAELAADHVRLGLRQRRPDGHDRAPGRGKRACRGCAGEHL